MSAVERVEEIAKGERHLTVQESRYWCHTFLILARELAIELDAARQQVYALQFGNADRWKEAVQERIDAPKPELTKAEKTSIRMKEYWANRKRIC